VTLLLGQYAALLLEPGHDAVDGLLEVGHLDRALLLARRQQRRLIDDVGEVGAREAGRARGDDTEVHAWRQHHRPGVQSQDRLAPAQIGLVDDHLAIEAPRSKERLVEHLGPVRGGHEDDALRGIEAVHLGEQLVEGLLALVVASDEPGAAGPRLADGVQLVDEDDAGRLVLGLLEQVAHARSAHSDEHLDELGAGEGEERHVRLAGHRAGEQRLARARGTHQKHALRNAPAEPLVFPRILQEVDDLDELRLRLVDARDVAERGLELLAIEDLVFGAAKRQGLGGPAADPAHEEHPDGDHDAERDDPAEHEIAYEGGLDPARELDLVLLDLAGERSLVDAWDARDREYADLGRLGEPLAQAIASAARPGG